MLTSPLLISLSGLVFGLLHTALASLRLKNWARRRWGAQRVDRWYRLFFSLAAGVTFVPLLALTKALPDQHLYTIRPPLLWLTGALQLVAALLLVVALTQTDVWRFIGLRQLLLGGTPIPADQHERLVTSGPYRWVRHPLYSTSIIFLCLNPAMTLNRLALALVCTAYFYLGSIPEEQKLLQEFGADYAHYQQTVPRLIPRPGRTWPNN